MREAERGTNHPFDPGTAAIRKGRGRHVPAAVSYTHLDVYKRQTLDHYGMEKVRELGLDLYGGCFNNRSIIGGKATSMHAWASPWTWTQTGTA